MSTQRKESLCALIKRGDISTLNGRFLKQWGKFTYLGSSVSSTKTEINTQLTKVWTAIDRLSVIWKSDLSDKIKRSFFFPSSGCFNTEIMGTPHGRWLSVLERKLDSKLRKNTASCIELVLEAVSHKAAAVRTPTTHLENHPN